MDLTTLLKAGAVLAGAEASSTVKDFDALLRSRLDKYREILGNERQDHQDQKHTDIKIQTAFESLYIVERVQTILENVEDSGSSHDELKKDDKLRKVGEREGVPVLGTRDMAQLRTLLSITFKWATEPLVASLFASLPRKPSPSTANAPRIIDLTSTTQDHDLLSSLANRLLIILFPRTVEGVVSQTFITTTLLNRHATEMLRMCISLGWIPESLRADFFPLADGLRSLTMRLLYILPPPQSIASLGSILSTTTPYLPRYVQKACSSFLSRQLLRSSGVHGLLSAMFGEEESTEHDTDAPIEKLEHVARVLSAVPAGMSREEYYALIIPRTLALLTPPASERTPPAHKRAAAFTLARMVALPIDSNSPQQHDVVASIFLPLLHVPLLSVTSLPLSESSGAKEKVSAQGTDPNSPEKMTPLAALGALTIILTNTDPAPTLISTLLTPIVPTLYSLYDHLYQNKTSDPALKETVKGLLSTWARAVSSREGVSALWKVIEGVGPDWKVDVAGQPQVIERSAAIHSLTLADLSKMGDVNGMDTDANPLNLRPDPAQFSRFLKSVDREDVSSEVFVQLLESYRELKHEQDGDPIQTLLRLQLIMQMQSQLIDTASSTNILKKPAQILSFVKHALEPSDADSSHHSSKLYSRTEENSSLSIEDLRIVPEDNDDDTGGTDSDDEDAPGLEGVERGDEMTVTAINLLLSILEANPDLSARSAPVLNDIFTLLGPLTGNASSTVRPLAREARLVMTARLASTSSVPSSSARVKQRPGNEGESIQETYQRALKLLQDPILPVRAHGLLLLREIVAPGPAARKQRKGAHEALDPALVPGILSVFLEAIQDDDSYIFLNAVQGLAAMVDGFGKDVLRSLVDIYTRGLDGVGGGTLTQKDVDLRVRVGEALGQVIRRCGGALASYIDIIVPPLFKIVRSQHLPTTVRTSAISLLGQCVDTNVLAILHYLVDLAEAMVDLVRIESIAATSTRRNKQPQEHNFDSEELTKPQLGVASGSESTPATGLNATAVANSRQYPNTFHSDASSNDTKDPHPASLSSKSPPLRRAALHFLTLLLRSSTAQVYDSTTGVLTFPVSVSKRAKTVLDYVAATDQDDVVRVMAREAAESVDGLGQALLGV